MKSKPPAFQWYPKQWLGDDNVILMDYDAKGMHVDLMSLSWQQEQPGTIPNEEALIRRWLHNPSNKTWSRVWPQLKRAWKIWGKNNQLLYSRGVLREYKKIKAFSRLQTEKINKRWEHRRKTSDTTVHTTVLPRNDFGNTRAGNTLQSSSSSADVKEPLTPRSGDLASPGSTANGKHLTSRQRRLSPRAAGTNPRAVASRLAAKAGPLLHLKPGEDPWATPEGERMSPEEMDRIKTEAFSKSHPKHREPHDDVF